MTAEQPSVQPPTREQIAALRMPFTTGQRVRAIHHNAAIDAVLALFPQSPPSSAPKPYMPLACGTEDCPNDSEPGKDHCYSCLMEQGLDVAAPPRIEDMAPGTRFVGQLTLMDGLTSSRTFMRVDGVYAIDDAGTRWHSSDIDPSTVRDVQGPPAMPEGDGR